MRILFLSRWFPYPPDNGAKLRVYHLLRGLASAHEVHLLSFIDHPAGGAETGLGDFCRQVRSVPWKEFDPRSRRARAGYLSLTPRSLVDTYSTEMEAEIRQVLREQKFDLVIISELQMTVYRSLFTGLPLLAEEIEVGVLHSQYAGSPTTASRLRNGMTWLKLRRYLRQVLGNQQPCTVVSAPERNLLQRIVPENNNIYIIPNGVAVSEYQPCQADPVANRLIFTGSFRYWPNYQAMVWFLEEVFPLIQTAIPDVRMAITGEHAGMPLPPNPAVRLTGYVDDVRPLIAQSWASVVPLQTGGGTRLKILESAALRTPVVSTTKGVEGLDLQDEQHLLIGDTPDAFARQTIRLLQDVNLRDRIAAAALQCVREQYDWQAIMPNFLDLVEETAARGRKDTALRAGV